MLGVLQAEKDAYLVVGINGKPGPAGLAHLVCITGLSSSAPRKAMHAAQALASHRASQCAWSQKRNGNDDGSRGRRGRHELGGRRAEEHVR